MKKYIILLLFCIAIATAFYYWRHPMTAKATIDGHTLFLDLAVTPKEKEQGLGGRENMRADTGMLFPYDHEEQYRYWMKDMRFPLDFIWIKGKTIIDITKNVPAPMPGQSTQDLPTYVAKIPVDKVLEVNAGTVDRVGIKEGDEIKFFTN